MSAAALLEETAVKTDEDLLLEYARTRAEDALEELIRRHCSRAFRIARKVLGDPQAAEDAAQETFVKLCAAAGSYEAGRPFEPWFYRVAENAAKDEARAARRRARREEEASRRAARATEAAARARAGATGGPALDPILVEEHLARLPLDPAVVAAGIGWGALAPEPPRDPAGGGRSRRCGAMRTPALPGARRGAAGTPPLPAARREARAAPARGRRRRAPGRRPPRPRRPRARDPRTLALPARAADRRGRRGRAPPPAAGGVPPARVGAGKRVGRPHGRAAAAREGGRRGLSRPGPRREPRRARGGGSRARPRPRRGGARPARGPALPRARPAPAAGRRRAPGRRAHLVSGENILVFGSDARVDPDGAFALTVTSAAPGERGPLAVAAEGYAPLIFDVVVPSEGARDLGVLSLEPKPIPEDPEPGVVR